MSFLPLPSLVLARGRCATIVTLAVLNIALLVASSLAAPANHPPALGEAQSQSTARININTATSAELTRLPGIGPALAARIITHRAKHGPFKRPQEIIVVRGMSAKRYRQLAHLIRI